jgi:mRNA deadenylase 3'-5' endonuclease subunit Ccr4
VISIEFDDTLMGRSFVTFDGIVVELFLEKFHAKGDRHHTGMTNWLIKAPDRKGVIDVVMYVGQRRTSSLLMKVDAANFVRIRPLLDALQQAGVPIRSEG